MVWSRLPAPDKAMFYYINITDQVASLTSAGADDTMTNEKRGDSSRK